MRHLFLNIFFFFLAFICHSQHNPVVTYYPASQYNAHHQNWDIAQHNDGNLFTANTNGLVCSDGNSWTTYSLPSKKIIRSLCLLEDKIFTGSHGEIGFWSQDPCGDFHYTSLKNKLPPGIIQNEEIWNIQAEKGTLWFQSFSVLLKYSKGSFYEVNLPGSVMYLQICKNENLIPVLGKGIYKLNEFSEVVEWQNGSFFKDMVVTGILDFSENMLLITTRDHGIFTYQAGKIRIWNPQYEDWFQKIQINRTIITKDRKIVLGTINDGIYIFSADGTMLYHLHAGNGLYNHTVLSLFENVEGDIWAGLDKGMAKIHLSNKSQSFKDVYNTIGSVYSAAFHQDKIYLGTNQGVYTFNGSVDQFEIIEGSQGQSWQLFKHGDELYCGHNEGLFHIKNNDFKEISNVTGGWFHQKISGSNDENWLQGNYTGLALLKSEEGLLYYDKQIPGFVLPVKKFIFYASDLWVTSPNNGLYKLKIDKDFSKIKESVKYDESKGLPNADNVDFNYFRDTLRAFDGKKHFKYNYQTDQFLPDVFFNQFAGTFLVRPLSGDQWLKIFPDYIERMNGSERVNVFPSSMNRDYHNVLPLSSGEFLLCMDDGYSLFPSQTNQDAKTAKIEIYIREWKENCTEKNILTVPGGASTFTIGFFDHSFTSGKTYQFRILPVQKEWKNTHTLSSIIINHLNPGEYKLEIMRNDGVLSSKQLKVGHPWYSSWPARLVYMLLALIAAYFIKRYYDIRLLKARLQHHMEQKLLVKQHEIELENQRLSHENIVKNKELANSALQLVHKNETLQEIKKELIEIRKSSHHVLTTQDFTVLMKQINDTLTVQQDQKLFDDSFEEVNKHFFQILMQAYPELSKEDMKLAAYIKMDLTSKEIAPLLNLSLRGLENKRYRLRKKLNLSGEENLTTFFRNLSPEDQNKAE